MANEDKVKVDIVVDFTVSTQNEFDLTAGENLPNHTTSMMGRGKFVTAGAHRPMIWRTKQSAYRFAAWLLALAEVLPNEPGEHTYPEVEVAIRNS